MKRYVLIISGGSLFAWGASTAIAGCGGEEATVADSDGGGASSSGGSSGAASSSGTASSSGGSSGSSGGDGGGGDGGGGDGGGDGGGGGPLKSNPGKITCGGVECSSDTQVCCQQGGDAGCVADNVKCGGFGTARLECDEKADCPGGTDICCASVTGGGTSCQPVKDCDGFGDFITCKTNGECAGQDGGTCKEWDCTFFKTAVKLRACENPAPQSCK